MGSGAVLPEGEIILVPVTIAEDAAPGEYALNVTSGTYEWYYYDNVTSGDYVETLTAGKIKVRESVPYIDITAGDVTVYPGETVQVPVVLDTNFTKRAYQPWLKFTTEAEGLIVGVPTVGKDLDTDVWSVQTAYSGQIMLLHTGGWMGSGAVLPEGEIVLVPVTVAADAAPGQYKLTVQVQGYEWYYYDGVTSGDYVQTLYDGTVTVKSAPVQTTLNAPQLTTAEPAANSIFVTAPAASAQDPNAAVEYAISEDGGKTYGAWQSSPRFENLKPDWEYYIVARYVAADTVWYANSEASAPMFLSTLDDSATYKPQVTVTIGDAVVQHGDEVVLPITFEHNLTHAEFKRVLLSFMVENDLTEESVKLLDGGDRNRYLGDALAHDPFVDANGYFVMVGNHNALSHSYELGYWDHGDTQGKFSLPEGEIFKLYVKIAEDAEPGTYIIGMENYADYSPAVPAFQCSHYLYGSLTDRIELTVNDGTITVKEPLAAPVLTDYTATDDTVTVTAPAAVTGATVQYAISEDGETYGEWQTGNVFTGLKEKTTYSVIARYVVREGHQNADSYAGEPLTVATVNPTVTYTLAEVTAKAGETVDVAVMLEHTVVKKATSFILLPDAAAGVEVTAVKAGKYLPEGWKAVLTGGVVMVYTTEAAAIPDGEVAILTYEVSADAADGEYTVSLVADFSEDGNCFIAADDSVLRVDGTVVSGKITVGEAAPVVPGDVNGDGTVDMADLITLRRHLAGWEGYELAKLNKNAMDINGDGEIGDMDAAVLMRHFAEWDGYEALPFVTVQ